jgi:hypothetical protein
MREILSMERPSASDKRLCARIAARVVSASRLEALPDCFQGTLSQNTRSAQTTAASKKTVAEAKVGIWSQTAEAAGLAYVRSPRDQERILWADIERIEPKNSKKRIVLLGESVARGYFYDPEFTPAAALATILQSAAGPDAVEVVDLARTDQLCSGLLDLAGSAVALRPDVLLIFAGNNWYPLSGLIEVNSEEISRVLRWSRRWSALTQLIETRTREAVIRFLKDIGKLSREHNIPVVFVLPEFNLADWRTEFPEPALMQTPEAAQHWREIRRAAEDALAKGDTERSARLSEAMMQLAGEIDSISAELLAQSLISQGHLDSARRLLERIRDISINLPSGRSPRCYSVIQETIRVYAARENIALVDLPEHFAEYLGAGLPGRRLFHDYCHLTVEGIRVAMASAAEQILPLLNLPQRTRRELQLAETKVRPHVEAQAHFLAAVHNAMWGQGEETVLYHCREAVRISRTMADVLVAYVDAYVRRAPTLFSRDFQQLLSHNAVLFRYFALGSRHDKDLNFILVDAMLKALEPLKPGITQVIWDLLIEQHSLACQWRNLLHPASSSRSIGEFHFYRHHEFEYYRALEIQSSFRFVCSRPQSLELVLTCRLPRWTQDSPVTLSVNGSELVSFVATRSWHVIRVPICADLVAKGVNVLLIQWPELSQSWEDRAHEVADQFEQEPRPTVFDVYGHIASFRIRCCS